MKRKDQALTLAMLALERIAETWKGFESNGDEMKTIANRAVEDIKLLLSEEDL